MNLDLIAAKLLKQFSGYVTIDDVVKTHVPREIEINNLVFRYGGREVSVSNDKGTFVWFVDSYGDRHSYMLAHIFDENGVYL